MSENSTTVIKKTTQGWVKFPLGIKLVIIVTAIILVSIWIIIALISSLVSGEFGRTAEENNFIINTRSAAEAEDYLYRIRSNALVQLDMILAVHADLIQKRQMESIFFERNQDIAAIIIPNQEELINQAFFRNNEADPHSLSVWLAMETESITRAASGEPLLRNVSPVLGLSLTAMFYPWQENGLEETVIIFFSPEALAENFGAGLNATVLVNNTGDILISADVSQVLSSVNIANNPLFDALRKSDKESLRLLYNDRGNRAEITDQNSPTQLRTGIGARDRFFGAGKKLSFADAAVLSSVEYTFVTGQINAATRRNFLLSVTVMFVAILVTWFFSRTITARIKRLMGVAERLEHGEFNLKLINKSHDELGLLTERFIFMGKALANWVAVKGLVGRFNNPEITGKALRNDLYLEGELKRVVIMEADFLSFAEVSQNLEPPVILSLLNRYILKMVESVEKTGGRVDKISGGRMTAVWGLPFSSKAEEGSPQPIQILGRIPTKEKIIENPNAAAAGQTESVETDSNPIDTLEEGDAETPAGETLSPELQEQLKSVLAVLPGWEQEILKMRFGLEDGNAHSQEEVGHYFNVDVERISQIEANALRHLKSPGGDSAQSAFDCVRSALMMRAAVWDFNTGRTEGGLPLFRMGCGIHLEEVLIGSIGSPYQMEYSFARVWVEPALLADKVNKSQGTDIIITGNILELIDGKVLTEELPSMDVEGVKRPIRLYAVVNTLPTQPREKQRWPFTLDDVRESLGTIEKK